MSGSSACGNCHSHPRSQTLRSKAVKLRASCDFCALSKVKCDRGQPQCGRCIRSGIECHYSESRRMGKARRLYALSGLSEEIQRNQNSRSNIFTIDQNIASESQKAMSSKSPEYTIPLDLFDSSEVADSDSGTQTYSLQVPSSQSNNDHQMLPPSIDFLAPQSKEDSLCVFGQRLELGGEQADYMGEDDIDWPIPSSGPGSSVDEEAVCFQEQQAEDRPGNCLKRALVAVESLHQPASLCKRPDFDIQSQATARPTLDATLKSNRTAVETVLQILSCPCACDWKIFFLLVLITHHVIDSRRMLLQQRLRTPTPVADNSSSTTDTQECVANTNTSNFDIPTAIGGYVLDGDMRTKVIMQVLRSEVEEMESLISILQRRYSHEELTGGTRIVLIEALRANQKRSLQALDDYSQRLS